MEVSTLSKIHSVETWREERHAENGAYPRNSHWKRAWYEDEEVLGDNWTFGFRVSLPIEDGPTGTSRHIRRYFQGQEEAEPIILFCSRWRRSYVFASSDSSVLDRMTEEVNRTHRVLSSESPIKEDVAARTLVLGEVTRTSRNRGSSR